ncbi:hypothetical protein ABKN59_002099 [Abortiporus biennis]
MATANQEQDGNFIVYNSKFLPMHSNSRWSTTLFSSSAYLRCRAENGQITGTVDLTVLSSTSQVLTHTVKHPPMDCSLLKFKLTTISCLFPGTVKFEPKALTLLRVFDNYQVSCRQTITIPGDTKYVLIHDSHASRPPRRSKLSSAELQAWLVDPRSMIHSSHRHHIDSSCHPTSNPCLIQSMILTGQ